VLTASTESTQRTTLSRPEPRASPHPRISLSKIGQRLGISHFHHTTITDTNITSERTHTHTHNAHGGSGRWEG
jgi:hypothetical protein